MNNITRQNEPTSLWQINTATTLGWCVVLTSVAYSAALVAASPASNPLTLGAMLNSLIQAGAFNLIAWAMIWRRVTSLPPTPASPTLIKLAVLLGLICAIPSEITNALALAVFGVSLLLLRPKIPGLTQAGALALALAASIGSPELRFVHLAVGRVDALLVAVLFRLQGVHVVVTGNLIADGNARIEVLAACASSAPLPGFVLAYTVIAILLRGRLRRSDLPWLLAALLASIALTEIRLSLMVPSEADWNYWHNGGGLTVYELAALSLACLFPVLAGMHDEIRSVQPRPVG